MCISEWTAGKFVSALKVAPIVAIWKSHTQSGSLFYFFIYKNLNPIDFHL